LSLRNRALEGQPSEEEEGAEEEAEEEAEEAKAVVSRQRRVAD